jgi:ferredoxin
LRSAAGSMQVAVTAAGFTTLFFVMVILAAALALGYGRRSDGARRPTSRPLRAEQAAGEEQPTRGGFQGGGKFGVSKHRDMLTVEVNPNKCARFGFCEHEAPEIFYLESDGRFGYETVVPVDKMEQVVSAMDVCPRRAIKVKLPPGLSALTAPPAPELPDDGRRTIIPIFGDRGDRGDRLPEDERPRRAGPERTAQRPPRRA